MEKLLGSVHQYDTAGKAAIARVRISYESKHQLGKKLNSIYINSQMCLSILSKWEAESPDSSSISRLTSEAKTLLSNCEVELEARDEDLKLLLH